MKCTAERCWTEGAGGEGGPAFRVRGGGGRGDDHRWTGGRRMRNKRLVA